MKMRTFFSAALLASSVAIVPAAHAGEGLLGGALSVQSKIDSVSKTVQGEQDKLTALKDKYANAPEKQRAKLQKRIDALENKVKSQQSKLSDLKNKYQNTASDAKKNLEDKVGEQKKNLQDLGSNAVKSGSDAVKSGANLLKGGL